MNKITARDVNVFYGSKQALFDVSINIQEKEVTALIGPSGCGKSTFLRCMNRMNDVIDICRVEGSIKMDDLELNSNKLDVVRLRENVAMDYQKPTPFPQTN